MATIIQQHPLYDTLPASQDVIFTVSNTNIVAAFTGVKMVAEVHISSGSAPNPAVPDDIVGTFKTSANNAGVGIFDFRPIIESFVKAENTAYKFARFKGIASTYNPFTIHIIDKYSRNVEPLRYMAIKFTTEYIDATGTLVVDNTQDNSDLYKVFNGYLKYNDDLDIISNNFGYNIEKFQLQSGLIGGRFLTNAPTTQYANAEDYGTLAFLTTPVSTNITNTTIDKFEIILFDDTNTQIGATINVDNTSANGGWNAWNAKTDKQLMFFGCFPGNLRNTNAVFNANLANISYYYVQAKSTTTAISDRIIIYINCPNTKGFKPIRLTWLNQWGGWDYYTFNMKSIKTTSTKGSTYQQLEGSWNERLYRLDSFRGGKKSFRVNATEKIKMNTDFVNESESAWFEDLINSPEVYIIEGFKTDETYSALNKYVTPVRLTTSSYTKKTIANDRLMQYTFEVEKTKTLRTQTV
tara:strand:+ start:1624 stop:3021 length:1398 start_codon:yes stop_codon:yes gene_type:complete